MGSKPFAYNSNTGTTIPGVTNYGTLAVATGDVNWNASGLQWYMGPDETPGYIISNTINYGGWRPQFWRSLGLTDADFIALINNVSGNNYTSTISANAWLIANNFYTTFIVLLTNFISAGGNSSISLNSKGQVWGWGDNGWGQLGDNSTMSKNTPVSILGNKKTFCQINAGGNYTIGIDKTGQVWGWGYNGSGQLGNNSTTQRNTPVSILGNKKTFCQITAGSQYTLGIDKTGQVWGWGWNGYGQLGINSTINRSTPVSILGNKKTFCQINAGNNHTIGIDKNGQVWGWGYNRFGQIGNNTTVSKRTPVSILGNKKTFCQIASGIYHSIGIDKNGQVWGWGYNGQGRLGDNSTTSRLTPVSILGVKKTFCQITAGYSYTIGIDKTGLVWGWGYNNKGQLGDNSTTDKYTPVSILGVKKTFCQINAGAYHTLGIDKTGQVWGWGWNGSGQLSNLNSQKCTPISILGNKKTFCQINAGNNHTIGIDKNGLIWGWGYNGMGQLGDNSTTQRNTPVSILGNIKTFCQISAGHYHTIGIDKTGQIWSWGFNPFGNLGDNSTTQRNTPVSILGNKKTFCQITAGSQYTLGIDKTGQVWGWGWNGYGQLGINSTINRSTPVSILGNKKTFCQINAGDSHTIGIDKTGQVWSWGDNSNGQLGINSTINRSTPVSILGVKKTFCQITAGQNHTIVIDKTGQVWGWGYNGSGQLGNNSTTSRLTPVSILGNKKTFCQITAGSQYTLGIDKTGQVWGWGYNRFGQLGINSSINKSTPVSILGNKKTFCQINAGNNNFTIGIDKNGQVWGWGYNSKGQLTDINTTTPIRVYNL
jgi:alpha-tubulin suppressor-like RCC1 family protein